MADHPSLTRAIARLAGTGRMAEVRAPIFETGESSPEYAGSRVRASYFFADREAYDSFAKRVRHGESLAGAARLAVDFSGHVDDMPIALLVPPRDFDATHAVSVTLSSRCEYRVVRRKGHHFYKFFSSPEEAEREAAIHRLVLRARPDNAVALVDALPSARVMGIFPEFRFRAHELPVCAITREPGEPYARFADLADPGDAKAAVGNLIALLEGLYAEIGFVHGDIHGGNALLTESGRILLLDFGMSEIHCRETADRVMGAAGTDVSYNDFSDEEIFLHIINDCAINERRVARSEYLHLYDIGRAIMKTVAGGIERDLADAFLPGALVCDPWLDRVDSAQFRNHFVCAFRAVNARLDNLASDRVRRLYVERM